MEAACPCVWLRLCRLLTAALAVVDRGYVLEVVKVALSGTGRDLAADPRVQRAHLGMT